MVVSSYYLLEKIVGVLSIAVMSSKRDKYIYWVATGLLTALMLISAILDIFYNDMVRETYTKLSYPTYIIYPLGIAKILGLIVIWSKKTNTLKKLAYAGFFFHLLLAFGAHINVNDLGFVPAIVGIVLLGVSYMFDKKIKSS